MTATTTITVRVTGDAKEKLDHLAALTRRSRSYLAAEALDIYMRNELEILDAIDEGIEDMKAGRVVPHDHVVAEAKAIIAAARAKKTHPSPAKRVPAGSRRKATAG